MNTETLRDLVVSLSLDSGDFEKHIRLINKSIREFESEFRLAGAGIANFETSLKGMGAKAVLLRQQLDGQNQIVGQYAKKLDALNEKLAENRAKHTSLSDLLERETKNRDELSAKVEEQRKEVIKLTQAYGADDQRVTDARNELALYAGALDDANKAVSSAQGKLTAVQKNIYSVGNAITDTNTELNNAKARVKELNIELARNESSWYKHGVAMQAFAGRAKEAAQSVDRVGTGLTAAITTPLIGAGAAMAKAAIDFESVFAGVRKTVTVSEEEAEEFFDTLSASAVQMSKTLATSASDVSEVMAIAGQLGIAKDALDEFTDVVVRMGMSTNMSTEDAATQMARFANITDMMTSEYKNLGSAVVYLGNNFATTEGEIMAMAMRIAAAGTQVGLSQSQILGFAAALSSLGLEAEAGGSAFSTALKKMEVAVETGGNALKDFATVSGLTQEEFKNLWKNNPADAFQAFITGLAGMDEAGESAVATLNEIGITQLRLSDTLLRSAGATELIAQAQTAANTAWTEGEALMKESNTRLETMASKLTNIKNTLVAAGISFGETMMPTIAEGAEWVAGIADGFAELDDATRRNIITWGLYAAATGPAMKALGKIGTTLTGGIDLMGKFAKRISEAKIAMDATGKATTFVSTLLGSGGGLMLGVTAVTAALTGLIALYHKVEAEKPNLAIDTSEIENYRIDIDALKAKIDVNATANIKGDILNLKDKFIGILNDGVPETQDIRNGMQNDVDAAVGEVYKLIEESYGQKRAELDALFTNGVIDEATYNNAISTLSGQAESLKSDLSTKANAVSAYITTLCDANRQMTDEEISALNTLLESLGETAAAVETAASAQMQAYEMAYDKTRLGLGTEEDHKNAIAYIELKAQQKIDEINAEKEALNALYAATTEGADDKTKAEEFKKLNAAQEALDQQVSEIEAGKKTEAARLAAGIAEDFDALTKIIEFYNATKADYEEESVGGGAWWKPIEWNPNAVTDALGITSYMGDMEKAIEAIEPHLQEGSPLMNFLATLQAQGILPEDALSSTENTLNTIVGLAAEINGSKTSAVNAAAETGAEVHDAAAAALDGYSLGKNTMDGVTKGIYDGAEGSARAMRWAMKRIQAVAKDEMDIHSPSRWAKDELGANTMKGFGEGFIGELPGQEKLMINAMKHLKGELGGATAGTTDNRRTYNSESTVNLTVERMEIRDQQDIQSLAAELAGLTRTQQRGRGVRYA